MVENQDAIAARRSEIASQPRPSRSEQAPNLKEAVQAVIETPDLWHVYVWERRWVWTSTAIGNAGKEQCWVYFADTYAGRVAEPYEETVDVIPASESQPDEWPWRLELSMPTLRGVFKLKKQAEEFVAAHPEFASPSVVARNSKDEFELKNYGLKKLIK